MADYVPSAIVVGGAAVIVGLLYAMRVPLLILMLVVIFSLFLVIAQHRNLFTAEYRSAKILNLFAGYAPFIIIGVVILISLFYIFFLRGLGGGRTNATASAMYTPVQTAAEVFKNTTATLGQNITKPFQTAATNLNAALYAPNNRNRANFLSALERAV